MKGGRDVLQQLAARAREEARRWSGRHDKRARRTVVEEYARRPQTCCAARVLVALRFKTRRILTGLPERKKKWQGNKGVPLEKNVQTATRKKTGTRDRRHFIPTSFLKMPR
jgi:hypothetical protein